MRNLHPVTRERTSSEEIFHLELRTMVYQAHDQIVAYALDTDLMGTGFDEEDAVEMLRQTVRLFLEDAYAHDDIESLTRRQAHPSFFERWQQPPVGVETGYLSMTVRLWRNAGIAVEPPTELAVA